MASCLTLQGGAAFRADAGHVAGQVVPAFLAMAWQVFGVNDLPTHAGPEDDFHFSEWRDSANVREFVSLFDSLLIRADEFRIAAETNDNYELDTTEILDKRDRPLLGPLRHLRQRIGTIRCRRCQQA